MLPKAQSYPLAISLFLLSFTQLQATDGTIAYTPLDVAPYSITTQVPPHSLKYDYLTVYTDEAKKTEVNNRRDEIVANAGADISAQLKFVLDKESATIGWSFDKFESYASKLLGINGARPEEELKLSAHMALSTAPLTLSNNYTTNSDLGQVFGFKLLGDPNTDTHFLGLSAGQIQTDATEATRYQSLKAVGVDTNNCVWQWNGSSWAKISEKIDHAHAAELAFCSLKSVTRSTINTHGRNAISIFSLGNSDIANVLGTVANAITNNAYLAAGENGEIKFYRLDQLANFTKQAVMDNKGTIWLIGADKAPYWGGNAERYKHLTSKQPGNFFLPFNEQALQITACDNAVAVRTLDKIHICTDLNSFSAWNANKVAATNFFDKSTAIPVPADNVAKIVYGASNSDLFYINSSGSVFRRNSSNNSWSIYSLVNRPVRNLSIKDGSKLIGKSLVLTQDFNVEILVDNFGETPRWRKLQQLTLQPDGSFRLVKPLVVYDACLSKDGSGCFLVGGNEGGSIWFASREILSNLGSVIGHLECGDSVICQLNDNNFLTIDQFGNAISKSMTLAEAKANVNCMFRIYKAGDIFALKAVNGKWLKFPKAGVAAPNGNKISANDDGTPEMNLFAMPKAITHVEPHDTHLIASINAVGDRLYCEPIARNSGGKIGKIGNFCTTLDSRNQPLTSTDFKFAFFKISGNDDLNLYLKNVETQPILSLQIGLFMQLFKDYVTPAEYDSTKFFVNLHTPNIDPSKPALTMADLLTAEWSGTIPTFVDEASVKQILATIKSILDSSAKNNAPWKEDDAKNLLNCIAQLTKIFATFPAIMAEIDVINKQISQLAVARPTTFDQFVKTMQNDLEMLLLEPTKTNLQQAFNKSKESLLANRVLGEGADDSYSKLINCAKWLVAKHADITFSSNQAITDFFANDSLKSFAEKMLAAISVQERIDNITRFLKNGALLSGEKSQLSRQIRKLLDSSVTNRLTQKQLNEIKELIGTINIKFKVVLEDEQTQALNRIIPLTENIRRLRELLNMHSTTSTDSSKTLPGLWDPAKDGATEAFGLQNRLNAYGAQEFITDLETVFNAAKAEAGDTPIAESLSKPLVLMAKQMLTSFSKGTLNKVDTSKLKSKVNAILEQLEPPSSTAASTQAPPLQA